LTIGADGLGTIAYPDAQQGSTNVKVAHCLDLTCTGASIRSIDTVGVTGTTSDVPGSVSIAGNPTGGVSVAYTTGGQHSLKVATCTDPGCAVVATQVTLEPTTVGGSPSIAIGLDGLPLLSYSGNSTATSADLVVAHCVNVFCTAITKTSVHTGTVTGWFTSTAIGGDGLGVVSYHDQTNRNVEVAHCADLTCGGLSHTTLDEFDSQGSSGTSTTIGADGLPLVTYEDATNHVLKVAHCPDVACALPLVVPF
jgi:hypothetical protein